MNTPPSIPVAIKEPAHVQPSGHASNVDVPQQQPASGSGSAGVTSGSTQQRKHAIKYVQPVSASWARHVTMAGNDERLAVDAHASDTKRGGSGDSATANKSSSGEGQVQSVRHCSQSTAHKRRKRVDFASAAEVAAAAVAAAATTPVVAAPAAAGLHPAQAAMLLSQLQYQQYAAHLAAGTLPHYPVPMLTAPPPPPPSPTPSHGAGRQGSKRSRVDVTGGTGSGGGGHSIKGYGSASTYSNCVPTPSYGVWLLGVCFYPLYIAKFSLSHTPLFSLSTHTYPHCSYPPTRIQCARGASQA